MADERVRELRAAVFAVCLPSVLGTLLLAALAAAQRTDVAASVGMPGPGVLFAALILVLAAAFLAAAYGPLLLPLAAAVLWAERRRSHVTDPIAVATLALAVAATIATYGWVLDAVELL
jgi:hypothetical protein